MSVPVGSLASQRTCRVGTRKSDLAKTQSMGIVALLESRGVACELVEISSSGDQDPNTPLYSMPSDSPGVFCKQLEQALLQGEIDLAIHSLKDLPTDQPEGLVVWAIPQRVGAHDVLIVHPECLDKSQKLFLKQSARVGTSSLRRQALLSETRPDLVLGPLRGNLPSRVDCVRQGKWDATVLAAAGLERLGEKLDLSGVETVDLSAWGFISAPGQGALAIEGRVDLPDAWRTTVQSISDPDTAQNVRIERRIMKVLEGGCTLPLGVHCSHAEGGMRTVRAFLGHGTLTEHGAHWESFERFELSSKDEEILVAQTTKKLARGGRNKAERYLS